MAGTKKVGRRGKAAKGRSDAPKTVRTLGPEEARLAHDFVVPVLKHMGFLDVSENHGIEALETVILFTDFDKFGNRKYHVAQVVCGDLTDRNDDRIQAIADNLRDVFDASFSDPVSRHERTICDIHIMVDGALSPEVVEGIIESSGVPERRGSVFFHDRRSLESLSAKSYQITKELLAAQCQELKRNSSIAQFNMESWDGGKASLFRYHSMNTQKLISHLVSKDENEETRKKLEKYFLLIDSYNQAANIVLFSDAPSSTTDLRTRLSQGASAVYKQSEELLGEVEALLWEPPPSPSS